MRGLKNKLLTLLHLQIIIDAVFFIVILILLRQLKMSISKKRSAVNGSTIQDLKKIVMESREFAGEFMTAIEENKTAFHKIARQLDNKAKQLTILLEEAERSINKLDSCHEKSAPASPKEGYNEVIKMIQQGMSREEVVKRSGITEGEVNLVIELARTRTNQ